MIYHWKTSCKFRKDPFFHYFLFPNTGVKYGIYALECISPVAVPMNEVACLGTRLHTPGFAPSVFQPLQGMFTKCFSAAGLEQVSKTYTCIHISLAYQSSRSNFCCGTTSDEQLLKPSSISSGWLLLLVFGNHEENSKLC